MNCAAARDLLPEHALGVAGDQARPLEEHLAWCAACRKESRDLQAAAATLAFAPAPTELPQELQAAVLARLGAATGTGVNARSRMRRGGTVLVAASVAVAVLGAGAVFASRSPSVDPVVRASRQVDAIEAFREVIAGSEFADVQTRASIGVLMPADGRSGSGSAMAIVGPTILDRAMVVVSGLPERPEALPYDVWLADAEGDFVFLGDAEALDSNGGFTVAQIVDADLRGFVNVIVRDRSGRVALRGTLADEAPVTAPGA